jgi:hypothetical protein
MDAVYGVVVLFMKLKLKLCKVLAVGHAKNVSDGTICSGDLVSMRSPFRSSYLQHACTLADYTV